MRREEILEHVQGRSLFSWVKSSNLGLQLILVLVIIITVFARVFPVEMQKKIVNQAITLRKIDLLLLYCGLYIGAVMLSLALKFLINMMQTYIGQQALACMRKAFFAHILALPLSFFRKASPGMTVSALVTELATAGEFVGQAIAVPLINILTLVAFAGYLFYLNPLLAALSMVLYPMAVIVVPVMQKRVNQANKERVDQSRMMSTMIGEVIAGIQEIQGNGSHKIENGKFSSIVDRLFQIRIRWNFYRVFIKISNNLFQSLGPFILLLVGGYLTIEGRFDLGGLVAFLAANEKLYDPWKELMDFYQTSQDAKVGYKRIVEYFDGAPDFVIEPSFPRSAIKMTGDISVQNVSFEAGAGIRIIDQINLNIKHGEQLALVGYSGSGKSTLALVLAQLYKYSSGSVMIDGHEVKDLPKYDITANTGLVSQHPFIFGGTIRENLFYSCRTLSAPHGVQDPIGGNELPDHGKIVEVLHDVNLLSDILRLGLNAVLRNGENDEMVQRLIRIREDFHRGCTDEVAALVEFFDPAKYLYFSSVAANILFGTPNRDELRPERLSRNEYFLGFLESVQLKMPLLHLGFELAVQAVDVFKDLPPDSVFFEESPIPSAEIDAYAALVDRIEKDSESGLSHEDMVMLLALSLRFIPGQHEMAELPGFLEELLLQGRSRFMERVSGKDPTEITFYRIDEYIYNQSILDNILFGKPKVDNPSSQERIYESITTLLRQENLLEEIIEIGLSFEVGSHGDRLSGGQKQKIALARAFLKAPPILILDEATAALDNASQGCVQRVLETKWKGRSTVIAVAHRLDTIKGFDRVAVMKAGRIVELGTYEELVARKGMFYELTRGF